MTVSRVGRSKAELVLTGQERQMLERRTRRVKSSQVQRPAGLDSA